MKNNTSWLITAKTNLHVGNENTSNYGIVDKAIQRDVLTKLPCINSSSLKGAINEFCTQKAKLTGKERINIFGSDKTPNTEKKAASQKGGVTFFDANILLLPRQGEENGELFYWITTNSILNRYREQLKCFDIECNLNNDDLVNNLKIVLGNNIRIDYNINDEQFRTYCDELNLPIIARNCLVDGKTNLWYEQVLPPETVFYTLTRGYDGTLEGALDNKIVQIGANATIGYGFCCFTKKVYQ